MLEILQHFPKPYYILALNILAYSDDELYSILKILGTQGKTTFLSAEEQSEALNAEGFDSIFCHYLQFISKPRLHNRYITAKI